MKLFLISQSENNGWDTYDSAVVAAEDEDAARKTHPSDYTDGWDDNQNSWYGTSISGDRYYTRSGDSWTYPNLVQVEYLAEYNGDAGVICASFNAG